MRIAYVTETYPPEINGVSLTCERAYRYLCEAGHDVQLIRPRQPGEAAADHTEEWRTWGCPLPMYPDLRFGIAWPQQLRTRWRDDPPDVVHAATPGPLAWAALRAAAAEGIPATADFRTNFHAYSRHYGIGWTEPWVCEALRRFHRRAHTTFVPTPMLAQELAGKGFERLQVVGRGIDALQYAPAHRDAGLRAQWGASDDEAVMLYVGRLAPEKNVGLALRSFEAARAQQPSLRMVVVGDGPLRRRLQADHPQVHFAGVQRGAELARHYASADLFAFPSLTDTFGNVVLEALASALVVVAFDTAAAGLHIHPGHSGHLVPCDDEAAFVAACAAALQDAAPDSPMRRHARDAALATDWPSVLRPFERQLRRVALSVPARARHAALA